MESILGSSYLQEMEGREGSFPRCLWVVGARKRGGTISCILKMLHYQGLKDILVQDKHGSIIQSKNTRHCQIYFRGENCLLWTEEDKYYMISLICEILKNDTNLYTKHRPTDIENKLTVTKGEREQGRTNQEHEIIRNELLFMKQKSNKDLLDSTGNFTQYLVINYNGT